MPCHDGANGQAEGPAVRPRYFDGQFLTAADFTAEQAYQVRKQRLHTSALHGRGIVCGLSVASEGKGSLLVSAGIAVDGLGREIVVPDPVRLDLGTAATRGGEVVLRYEEIPDGMTTDGEPSRVVEGYGVAVERPRTPPDPGAIVLAEIECSPDGDVTVLPSEEREPVSVRQLIEAMGAILDRVARLEERVTALSGTAGI